MSQSEIQFYCIDRIEGEYAIIERPDGKMINIKTENLPKEIKEGDCLKKINNIWIIDEQEKNRRISRINNLLNRLKNKSK